MSLFVGVLALQGDFDAHAKLLNKIGIEPVLVRTPSMIASIDALVIPGGESTTIAKLATEYDLVETILLNAERRLRIIGTCAGLILCAKRVADGDEPLLGLVDITVRRNAYGRQVDSFETDLEVAEIGEMHAVFIRAPVIEEVGPDVEVLATYDGHPVVVRQENILLATFHPELTGDARLHDLALHYPPPPRRSTVTRRPFRLPPRLPPDEQS